MDWFNLETVKNFLYKVTEVLALFVAVSLLVGIIFGPETAFFGSVVSNFSSILSIIGEEGLIALVSLLIIAAILKRKIKFKFLEAGKSATIHSSQKWWLNRGLIL